MNPRRRRPTPYLFIGFLALLLAPTALEASEPQVPLSTTGFQLLANPGLEYFGDPYDEYNGVDCQVATYWQRFWDESIPVPFWMDTRVFAASQGSSHVERIEGDTCQLVLSTEPYAAGLWQRVTGLTPGLGYGFHAALLTIFQSSAQPPVDGTMIKQVGIDPTGGIDPGSPDIIWSEPNGDDKAWDLHNRTAVFAQSPEATVFIRVISPYPSGDPSLLNLSILDSAILAQTGSVTAVSPEASEETQFTVRWDNAVASPDGEIRWYDVQWSDAELGVWHDWKVKTVELSAPFTGERNHTYRFRARVWQRYPNNAHLVSPYREEGDTETVIWSQLRSRVLGPEGQGIARATVGILGTDYQASSGPGGLAILGLPPQTDLQAAFVKYPPWLAPPPVYGLDFGLTGSVVLTMTLRPAGDVVVNGGFEDDGLQGWQAATGAACPVTGTVHSGLGAAALGGLASSSLSQTVEVSGAWEPALSFWYQPENVGKGTELDV
ncbi:MAG: hypothetical protein M8467_19975, partial [Anaerolineae bacterium]|nr:hypothetical protein [Anaerolineae bacterium]